MRNPSDAGVAQTVIAKTLFCERKMRNFLLLRPREGAYTIKCNLLIQSALTPAFLFYFLMCFTVLHVLEASYMMENSLNVLGHVNPPVITQSGLEAHDLQKL